MDQINHILQVNAPLGMLIGFLLWLGKDFARDWLNRDAAAKLADKDLSNDGQARLEQSIAKAIDGIPTGNPLIRK